MAHQDYNPYAAPSREADHEWGAPSWAPDGILATPLQRWIGSFIDTLVFIPAAVPFGIGSVVMEAGSADVELAALLVVPILAVLILQWVLIANNGQSIGKRVIKTRIVRLDGSNPGFVHGVLLRSFVINGLQFIPLLGYLIALADALFVFRGDRRTIHDHIAGTRVIQA